MNKPCYAFIFLLFIITTCYSENDVNNNNQNQINVIQNNTNWNVVEIMTKLYQLNWKQYIDTARRYSRDQYDSIATTLTNYIRTNKYKMGLYAAGMTYSSLCGYLLYTSWSIDSSETWANWKHHCTLEELLKLPQAPLAQELLAEVQKRYATVDDLYDFITPLVQFIKAVDTEIGRYKRFVSVHASIDRLHIGILFPRNTKLQAQAYERIHRLSYLKNILLSWLSEHKIAMNKPNVNRAHKNQILMQHT